MKEAPYKIVRNLPKVRFNLVLYHEVALMIAIYLGSFFGMPYLSTTLMGVVDIAECIWQIQNVWCAMPNVKCATQHANQKKKKSARRRAWRGNINAIYGDPSVGWQGEKKMHKKGSSLLKNLVDLISNWKNSKSM